MRNLRLNVQYVKSVIRLRLVRIRINHRNIAGIMELYVSLTAVMGAKHIPYLQILAYVFIQKIMINIGMLISGSIFNWDC